MTAVRETFYELPDRADARSGPPSTARLPDQARQEAKASNCPFVLFTSVKQVHSSGGRGQQPAESRGGKRHSAGRVRGRRRHQQHRRPDRHQCRGRRCGRGGDQLREPDQAPRNDELTLTARLESGDGKVLVNSTNKKKAESSGEDLLTPLVEKAATAVAGAVAKGGK